MAITRKWQQPTNETLFEIDPLTGIKTYFSSFGQDTWQFRYEFPDVSPEIEASKELAKTDDHWDAGVKNDMVHYAHIPDPILLKWHAEGVNINDNKELVKMVNKPEWAYLRNTRKIHR